MAGVLYCTVGLAEDDQTQDSVSYHIPQRSNLYLLFKKCLFTVKLDEMAEITVFGGPTWDLNTSLMNFLIATNVY